MRGLRAVSRSEGLGARRWDVIIVGSGLCGIVAASRLGMAGQRVLVVEEEEAHAAFAGLREPFLLTGMRDKGLVDTCLRELTLPLIERRRIESQEIAVQLVGPDLRLDVGGMALTARELVSWGVAKPDDAKALVRALAEASEAERRAMLAAPLVRIGRRVARARPGTRGSHVRGLPAEAARPNARVAPLLAAQVRALSNLGEIAASPEARARLLGSLLAGGAGFSGGPPWLSGLLRRRAQSLHVEFRTLSGAFELVDSSGEPGVLSSSKQLWLCKAMVLAAPFTALAECIDPDSRPSFLATKRVARRRLAVHFRCKANLIPEGMAPRVILIPDPSVDPELDAVTVAVHVRGEATQIVDIVARAVAPGDPREDGAEATQAAFADRIENRLRSLLPFADKKLVRVKAPLPRWDDDDWLEDPPPGQGWPAEIDLRVNTRPPVYRLDRAGTASLGVEGDVLLGWRAGDAIAAEF